MDNRESEDVAAIYSSLWPKYDAFCRETRRIVVEAFKAKNIECHTVEARAKDVASFAIKAKKRNIDDTTKYLDPLTQITDLAAIRIITYTLDDVETVCAFMQQHFDVIEKTNVGEKRFEEGKFGYQSIHLLLRYPKERVSLPENAQYSGMVCEVQVRTVLQHAWAEIEHDIQYKNPTGLPVTLQRKFTALAGLLEIADREFQSIQDLSEGIKKSVSESLQEDLTRDVIAESADAEAREDSDASARQLASEGRYGEAVRLYDEKIVKSPTMHTLFIGRAKAKFLSGDRAGAIQDLDRAAALNGNDAGIAHVRLQIDEGFVPRPLATRGADADEASRFTQLGNQSLQAGDGAAAFEYFSKAQEGGASRPFSLMNKALACIIASDFEGARLQLSALEMRRGTPFAVTLAAANLLIDTALGFGDSAHRQLLEDTLLECPNFSLEISPLKRLLDGLAVVPLKISGESQSAVDAVFSKLKNHYSGGAS